MTVMSSTTKTATTTTVTTAGGTLIKFALSAPLFDFSANEITKNNIRSTTLQPGANCMICRI